MSDFAVVASSFMVLELCRAAAYAFSVTGASLLLLDVPVDADVFAVACCY